MKFENHLNSNYRRDISDYLPQRASALRVSRSPRLRVLDFPSPAL